MVDTRRNSTCDLVRVQHTHCVDPEHVPQTVRDEAVRQSRKQNYDTQVAFSVLEHVHLTDHTTCDDTIREPGKFEAEPAYVRDHVWQWILDGDTGAETGDGEAGTLTSWYAGPFDCPAMADLAGVAVWETSTGPVSSSSYRDEATFLADLKDAQDRDEEEDAQNDQAR